MDKVCVNCRKEIPEGTTDFFQGILVCQVCGQVARTIEERLARELRQLHLMSLEAIRVALVQGRLSMSQTPADRAAGTTKADILRAIVQLSEKPNG